MKTMCKINSTVNNADVIITVPSVKIQFRIDPESQNLDCNVEQGEWSVQATNAGMDQVRELLKEEHVRKQEDLAMFGQAFLCMWNFMKNEVPEILKLAREEQEKMDKWDYEESPRARRKIDGLEKENSDLTNEIRKTKEQNEELEREIEYLRNRK